MLGLNGVLEAGSLESEDRVEQSKTAGWDQCSEPSPWNRYKQPGVWSLGASLCVSVRECMCVCILLGQSGGHEHHFLMLSMSKAEQVLAVKFPPHSCPGLTSTVPLCPPLDLAYPWSLY